MDSTFEALGNVVITHHDETIYGEAASLNMQTGDVIVKGNVRYISFWQQFMVLR
ncbi:MAG: hypothetical protein U0T83_09390 [Bacteriovoracaceae bacterium]